jgi:hypothetical protein
VRLVGTIVAILLTLSLGTLRAEAETFDCQHPSIPLARLICSDPVLRAADADENGIYGTALTASLDKAALREEERAWFAAEILPYNFFVQHQMPVDNAKVAEAYRQRDEALRQETQAWRKLRHGVSGATLTASCLALPTPHGDGCSVAAFAPIEIEGASSLRYQLQTYAQPPPAHSAVVIFAATQEQPDTWLPLAVTASKDAPLAAPQATVSPFGTLLTVASSATNSDGSALYRLTPEALEDIDDRSWLDTLRAHLPDGLALSPEIVADYGKMQALGTTARSQSSCCAVGSRAVIDLAIEDDRVVIKGVTFGEPQGSPGDHAN